MRNKLYLGMACLMLPAIAQAEQVQLFVGTPWKIAQVGSHTGFANGLAELSLSRDGALSAFAGCNGLGGRYVLEGTTLRIERLLGTQMACDEAKMRDEQALIQALNSGAFTVREHAAGATLTGEDGLVIELVPVAEYPDEE